MIYGKEQSMRFKLNHDRRNISDEDLLSDLRRVAAEKSESQVKQRTYGKPENTA